MHILGQKMTYSKTFS